MSSTQIMGVVAGALSLAVTSIVTAQQQTGPERSRAASPPHAVDAESAPRPVLLALRISRPIEIDGLLDEPAWQLADSATGFIQTQPDAGYPATERTVVRVLYDERNLYVGAVMYDSRPDRLRVPGLEQDFATHDADMFGVVLDTYLDRQNAFLFGVNPEGGLFDAQAFNDSRYVNRAWEGVVHRRTRINENGWTAEMAIPLTTLRFEAQEGEQSWGLNFLRRVRRRNEDSYWAPLARQFRIHKMSRAGTLVGLESLRQGRNLTVKPYVRGAHETGELRDPADRANTGGVGLDVKYGVTPRLSLDLTAFTDFSQVEVDQEQVNLTRFSLFFPEKRDFFLENEGTFALGDVTERNYRTGSSLREFKLFHSRRIGLSADRRPIPIAGGGRLSGRIGDLEVGLLEMQTRESELGPAENFVVARVRRTVIGNSDVGVMFVNRQGTSQGSRDRYNRAFGVDANFHLLRHMMVNSYVAATDDPQWRGDAKAAWLQVAWRDPVWNVSGFAKYVGEAFNPSVGFVRRRAMRQLFATVGAHPRPASRALLEVNPYVDVSFIADPRWTLESRLATGGFGVTFMDGGTLSAEYSDRFERLQAADSIAGVLLAAGDYGFTEVSLAYRSSGARWISGSLRVSHGGFYDGTRTTVSATAVLRPDYHVSFDLLVQRNDLNLGGTAVAADVFGGRIRYALSTELFTSAFVQYNALSEELVTNLRFNFIHAPLSDFFLVYSERRSVSDSVLLDRVITAKVTKLLAF